MTRDPSPWRSLPRVGVALLIGAGRLAAQGGDAPQVLELVGPFVADVDLRDLPVVAAWQPGDPIVIVPEGHLEDEEPGDGILETRELASLPETPRLPQSGGGVPFRVNREGIPFSGVRPPDTVGDAGPDHYIQATNRSGGSSILVLDKQGATVAGPFELDSLWTGGGPCGSGLGDPIVAYDRLADRWLMSEFASVGNHLCIYVSMTPDPLAGGWFLYDFTTPSFPDYPKYGVWPDGYYASTYESPFLGVYALDRAQMLAGQAATAIRFQIPALTPAPRDSRILPAHFGGGDEPTGAPNFFLRTVEAGQDPGNPVDRIEIHEFHADFAVPANSSFTLVDSLPLSFAFPPCVPGVRDCIPQPNTGARLDALPGRPMMQNFFRHDAADGSFRLYDTQSVDAGGEVWAHRWWELARPAAADGISSWQILQEGTYAPDGEHRWMGSIAANGAGEIALGYSISGTVFPGIRLAGRAASDPAGTLPKGEYTVFDGAGIQTTTQRWGDYSGMSVDPGDDKTFWYTQEYLPASGLWNTRIVSFDFDVLFLDGFETGDLSAWDEAVE